MKKLSLFFALIASLGSNAQSKKILMFVSHEQAYYSEYIVMRKALEASGYTIDLRSAGTQPASIYMVPNGTDIEATANTLQGSSYAQFTQKFQELTGTAWSASWNATPASENVDGRIQDVKSMSGYAALVIVGGTGALDYRVDGTYSAQGSGGRLLHADSIKAAAEQLNKLGIEAVSSGKPVLAQCHGASLIPFWRIPGTTGPGVEALGFSLLKDQFAAGYPEAQTPIDLATLNVNYRENDRVTVSSPHSSLANYEAGRSRIITSKDWYPQTVLHAAQTVLNILKSYPKNEQLVKSIPVLILHGGPIDSFNCGAGNRANDVPCNYGTGTNLPADYVSILTLLNANSPEDGYNFTVSDLNLTGNLPYDANGAASTLAYLRQFKTIVFFKHWSTGINDVLQNALKQYADEGGGLIALHHGLYNDIDGPRNKNILVQDVFGVESAMNTWSANLTNYEMYSTNYGHFISTYGINYGTAQQAPAVWTGSPLLAGANASFSYYLPMGIYDELYNNMAFVAGQQFGWGQNQITTLFSNNQTPGTQSHTSGFLKMFNPSLDSTVGKVVYFEAGERKENISVNHKYGQVIRNAVFWAGTEIDTTTTGGGGTGSVAKYSTEVLHIYPNPTSGEVVVQLDANSSNAVVSVYGVDGKKLNVKVVERGNGSYVVDLSDVAAGVYFVEAFANERIFRAKVVKQ